MTISKYKTTLSTVKDIKCFTSADTAYRGYAVYTVSNDFWKSAPEKYVNYWEVLSEFKRYFI